MDTWSERECRIACKRENPNFDFDNDNEFDYSCCCYKSALKAYKSLLEDGHSGCSFNKTKRILIRLMDNLPLTPITDDDFFLVERGTKDFHLESDEYLKERGLKSSLQCPRMYSLFRKETIDGKVTYKDIDRAYFIDIEEPSNTYHSSCEFLDGMFPISMPYYPTKEKYKIYEQTFLIDKKNGDFDTRGILYLITPDGKKIDVNIFMMEKNGKWIEISKEEYKDLLSRRIDKLENKIASHLIWTLISNSSSDFDIEEREKLYENYPENLKDDFYNLLVDKCKFFNNPDNYKYNTFDTCQNLCRGNVEKYKNVSELIEISNLLLDFLDKIRKF